MRFAEFVLLFVIRRFTQMSKRERYIRPCREPPPRHAVAYDPQWPGDRPAVFSVPEASFLHGTLLGLEWRLGLANWRTLTVWMAIGGDV